MPMDALSLAQLRGVDTRFGADALAVFDYERSVEMKDARGGTSRRAVEEQIRGLRGIIEKGGE